MSSPAKRPLGIDVLEAARQRISLMFDRFDRVYLSFSGGKDSTVLFHLTAAEARRRGRAFGLLFIDLEAQYRLTIDHVRRMVDEYADVIDLYWVALPLHLRNAVSNYQTHWVCWDPAQLENWVRMPPHDAITDPSLWPWFRHAMEFEEFIEEFAHWYSGDGQHLTACLVGIRTVESLNRWRTVFADKQRFENLPWTTWIRGSVYNAYPIYDWRTEDIWTFHARYPELAYNELYDRFHQAGLTIHQMRICQPYGDDQRKGLWLYHIIEPETWARLIGRVAGANYGALYARETGNILGRLRITRPANTTWQEYCHFLLESMPKPTAEHYRDKIAVFLRWWAVRGWNPIPDEAPSREEVKRSGYDKLPSWERIAKVLLVNDYWCKRLSFSQTKSDSYERYRAMMQKRRAKWGIF